MHSNLIKTIPDADKIIALDGKRYDLSEEKLHELVMKDGIVLWEGGSRLRIRKNIGDLAQQIMPFLVLLIKPEIDITDYNDFLKKHMQIIRHIDPTNKHFIIHQLNMMLNESTKIYLRTKVTKIEIAQLTELITFIERIRGVEHATYTEEAPLILKDIMQEFLQKIPAEELKTVFTVDFTNKIFEMIVQENLFTLSLSDLFYISYMSLSEEDKAKLSPNIKTCIGTVQDTILSIDDGTKIIMTHESQKDQLDKLHTSSGAQIPISFMRLGVTEEGLKNPHLQSLDPLFKYHDTQKEMARIAAGINPWFIMLSPKEEEKKGNQNKNPGQFR